ncbi:unnamed protein product [Symbiodinium natans]|uniref:Uncharacterized protein n=1 Tax=Symbiodinium natans TaxID=878477 RepID=A0A812N3I4_9DINO|nr:unnamed protein product [Symbiodinium natans]
MRRIVCRLRNVKGAKQRLLHAPPPQKRRRRWWPKPGKPTGEPRSSPRRRGLCGTGAAPHKNRRRREAAELALAQRRARIEAASSRATASDAEIVKLRQMLQHRQADLVRAELQADMAARRASELLQQSELELPSSTSRSPRTPEPPAANLSLPSGKRASAGPDLSARVSADLENILEAVKQHELNMAAVKSELVSEAAMSLQGKGDAAAVDEMLVLTRLRSRRDEHEEQVRVLEATCRTDRARRHRADENILRDLFLLEEAASEFRTSLASLESSERVKATARGNEQARTLQLQEAVEDRAEVREELAVARCLIEAQAKDAPHLLAELCGRRETLRAKDAVQQARLGFLTAAAGEASRAATKANLLALLPRRMPVAPKNEVDMVAIEHQTGQLREEVAALQKQVAEKGDAHAWQQEMLEIRSHHERLLSERAEEKDAACGTCGTRLPAALAKTLRQLRGDAVHSPAARPSVKQTRKANDSVAKVAGSLLQLLAETQHRAVCNSVAAEGYRKTAQANAARGTSMWHFPRVVASQMEQARDRSRIEEASCLETHERARLEAAAGELFSELEETREQCEQLEAQRMAAVATLRAREAAAADEACAGTLEPSWRDEAVEEAWRRAREAGRVPTADGDAEDVLRAAQVLRLLGLQLVHWEVSEGIKSAQLRADGLELANAALARVVVQVPGQPHSMSTPRVLEAFWTSKRTELAEAEQRQREASRLQAEVQTFHTELARAQRSEAEAASELAAAAGSKRRSLAGRKPPKPPETHDPKLLAGMLDVMSQVMEMCSGMLPAREPAATGSKAMAAVLREVKDLGGFCQMLQQQVPSQRQSLSSAVSLHDSSQMEGGQRDATSRRMEALLELQHELQLQYKSAADAVLVLRQDVSQRSRLEEELQSELRSKEQAILAAEESAADMVTLPLPHVLEVTPEAAQLKELCRLERRCVEDAATKVDLARRKFEEQRALATSAAARAAEEVAKAEGGCHQLRLAKEAGGRADADLAKAQQQRQHREEAKAEELAASEWALKAEEEQRMKENLKQNEEKLKEEVQEAERLRHETLRVESANWELQKRLSPSLKRIDELRHRRATLETETRGVGAYPERAVKATQERVLQVQGRISDIFGQLEQTGAEEQQHKAESLVYASEAAAAAKLGADAAQREAAAELRLEAVQAKEQWQEIAHRDEHHAWRTQVQELEEQQWRSRRAREAAEASQLEVNAAIRCDAARQKVVELREELEDAESHCAAQHGSTAPRQREQVLLTELAAIRSQETTLLEEMEALRQEADADAEPVSPVNPVGRLSLTTTHKPTSSAATARELQRLHAQLRRAREQKEVLKQEVAAGEREEDLLRKELEEVEQHLRLSRDDAERKRAFIATLQNHCVGEASTEHLEAQAKRQAELSSSLAKARQSLASKETRLKALRAEAAEAKRRRETRRDAAAADARRCAADLARTKALRSELRRKERALQELWAQSEVMESRLEESYSAG